MIVLLAIGKIFFSSFVLSAAFWCLQIRFGDTSDLDETSWLVRVLKKRRIQEAENLQSRVRVLIDSEVLKRAQKNLRLQSESEQLRKRAAEMLERITVEGIVNSLAKSGEEPRMYSGPDVVIYRKRAQSVGIFEDTKKVRTYSETGKNVTHSPSAQELIDRYPLESSIPN